MIARRLFATNGWFTLLLLVSGLLAVEIALHVKAQIKNGRGLFPTTEETRESAKDPETGLNIFSPNSTIKSLGTTIVSNAYGLRSPQISTKPQHGEYRIAVMGASTVAGAYTPRNEQLFSYRLADMLKRRKPGRRIGVINAGIPGYSVSSMRTMLERRVLALHPQLVLLYSGFNDIASFCQAASTRSRRNLSLPYIGLPSKLLLPEIVKKNTVDMRISSEISGSLPAKPFRIPPAALAAYRAEIEAMARQARRAGADFAIVSSLTAHRAGMPLEQQQDLSKSALYYYGKCLDHQSLNATLAAMNSVQRSVAREYGIPYIDLTRSVAGGRANFVDSTHLTVAGEEAVAEALTPHVIAQMD